MRAQSNGDEDAELVYRPMLFESTGYTSFELFRDSFEMRSRLPTGPSSVPLLGVKTTAEETQERMQGIKPQIRLETLSSRAATTVVWVTYLSFLLAIVLPYLQGKGYLETAVELSGAVCKHDVRRKPCIEVDTKQKVAHWAAYVANVSRYTENVELKLHVRTLVNSFASFKMLHPRIERKMAHERIETVWASPQNEIEARNNMQDQGLNGLIIENDGYVLTYDVKLYGFNQDVIPATKDVIVDDHNQSVWVECQVGKQCDEVRLVEITQDVDRLGGSGYNAYFVIVMFRGLYPNVFGKDVVYDFTFTKPAIQIGEVVVRGILVLVTILGLPCWLITVLNFHDRSWSKVLTVQKWLLGVGIVLVLWQNPVYAVSEFYTTMSMRTRFVSITSQSLAEAFFYVFWLCLIDQYCGRRSPFVVKFLFGLTLFGVDTLMTVLRMPGLFPEVAITSSALHSYDELYTLLGFIRTGLLLVWLVWSIKVGVQSGRHLKALPYMATRFKQLSYRFLVLQMLLIFIYIFVLSTLQTFYLLRTWSIVGYNAFIQDSVHYFAKMHTGHPSLGQFLFLSVNVYLVMYVHLPPLVGDRTGLLVSTAVHVDDPTCVKSYDLIPSNPSLFCVKTAGWLLELAYQAYFDPPGCPSLSGYGELSLEQHGFELITHLRNNRTDTHVVVAWSQADHRRLVISFRGTTSKENWKSNLRADQTVLWMKSRGLRWRKSCLEKAKDVAAKIPLLNMALPRVHRGFWLAYESIRDELKEVTRLILDENPGILVYVTGHSMGGALAVLAAYDLVVNLHIQVNMYNFGGPRVGNPSFRQHYDNCVSTSYRVVMDGDIVPGWPKFWGLYQHVGTEISLDVAGNLIVDPSFIERHLHNSSRRKTTMHGTNVYRLAIASCLKTLTS